MSGVTSTENLAKRPTNLHDGPKTDIKAIQVESNRLYDRFVATTVHLVDTCDPGPAIIKTMFIKVGSHINIPMDELEFTFVRSSGPGGQNVNKVNTKAVLRWNALETAAILSEPLRARILAKIASKLTKDGDLVISGDRFRDQIRNREDCLEKFRAVILEASHIPKARKKTKPSRSSQRRAKESKTRQSEKKSLRRVKF